MALFVLVAIALIFQAIATVQHRGQEQPQKDKEININPAALNPQLTPLLPLNGGPQLGYNGWGDVPPTNTTSPTPTPLTPLNSSLEIEDSFFDELVAIVEDKNVFQSNCSKCVAGAELLHFAAITQPVSTVTSLLIRACNKFQSDVWAASCEEYYSGVGGLGPYFALLFAKGSAATGDFAALCYYHYGFCEPPPLIEIDESYYFSPKPARAYIAPEPGTETIEIMHLGDTHYDPRYAIGSEANCTQSFCCRPDSTNEDLHTDSQNPSLPASRFGSLLCDTPADLLLSVFEDMGTFINKSDLAFTVFTGDISSRDNADQMSQAYTAYENEVLFRTLKAQLGNVPVYPTLGNHDTYPELWYLSDSFGSSQAWNYNLVSSLWLNATWIDSAEAEFAATHFGAFAHTTAQGLRIISIASDFYYTGNDFSFVNYTNPDPSGTLKFLADELTACEQREQRAWVIAHVVSGYAADNALPNPSALFQSIIIRFSPSTIAGVFHAHAHKEEFQIFYEYAASSINSATGLRNTTDVDYTKPVQVAWIGGSISPITANNPGYTIMQLDSKTFSVMGSQTYITNIGESLTWSKPVWQYEYDVRSEYSDALPSEGFWPATSPLNATFMDRLTQGMEQNISLVERYNLLESKSSIRVPPCDTADCQASKVCLIRSGSAALGQACIPWNML
ncbi:Sphingomyelin phosphodiesterase B [Lachnellula occidentalis]|uniref:Sphingomyelin phosphodiesterase B n=1 Tax=Lachnellula occidentalis TaxID=215460 RepID=A0A8H8RRI3_9HELO|nr:Sphingomyelin phosphodiesterase B [Lachnellula occidentalis]